MSEGRGRGGEGLGRGEKAEMMKGREQKQVSRQENGRLTGM